MLKKTYTFLCAVLVLSLFGSPVSAQVDWAAVETQIEGIRSTYNLPSIGYAVVVEDEPVFTGAVGKANITQNIDATGDTPYMLASISKTYISMALLQLIEDGQLSLNDPINDHLPWTVDNPRVSGEVIRVKHLVTHTSGIQDANIFGSPGSGDLYYYGDTPTTLAEFMQGIKAGEFFI